MYKYTVLVNINENIHSVNKPLVSDYISQSFSEDLCCQFYWRADEEVSFTLQ